MAMGNEPLHPGSVRRILSAHADPGGAQAHERAVPGACRQRDPRAGLFPALRNHKEVRGSCASATHPCEDHLVLAKIVMLVSSQTDPFRRQLMVLWNSFLKNLDPVAVPMPVEAGLRTWDEAFQAQQHYWNNWIEAGQLWMSWWVSALPPVPWPPAGPMMPAAWQPTASALSTATVQEPSPPTARKPRAAAASPR